MTTRMARFLTSLYPRRWRERYEHEFLQFLQEHPLSIYAVFNVIGSALCQRFRPFSHRQAIFSLYTKRARRAVFFARYEASQFGSSSIESEHLLLGVLREGGNGLRRFFADSSAMQAIFEDAREQVTVREKNFISTNLPLSSECKRILAYTQEEADRLNDRVGVEHLLFGILREEESNASGILRKHGLQLSALREKVVQSSLTKRH
jgi:ATP-dependent Clp protease ATP-binding subunit ClpC